MIAPRGGKQDRSEDLYLTDTISMTKIFITISCKPYQSWTMTNKKELVRLLPHIQDSSNVLIYYYRKYYARDPNRKGTESRDES